MTASLDYLQDLGVTAVWMNPIFPSPPYHGYQHGPADQVNPWFGTEAAVPRLRARRPRRRHQGLHRLRRLRHQSQHSAVLPPTRTTIPRRPYDDWLAFTNTRQHRRTTAAAYTTWNGASVGYINWNLDHAARRPSADRAGPSTGSTPNGDGDPSDGIDGYRLDHVACTTARRLGLQHRRLLAALEGGARAVNPDVFTFAEQADWGSHGAELLARTMRRSRSRSSSRPRGAIALRERGGAVQRDGGHARRAAGRPHVPGHARRPRRGPADVRHRRRWAAPRRPRPCS